MIKTADLKAGDRIIVPDHFGEILIPVTVTRVVDVGSEVTISYKRDKAQGGRRDYLFAERDEEWEEDY